MTTGPRDNPGVSIIVPLLNESAVVKDLIAHLTQLIEQDDALQPEVIIVDGGSHDGTCGDIEAAGLTLIHSDAGRATQMNAGAAVASQPLLLFLHADTRLPENYFSELQRADAWGRFDVRFDVASPTMKMVAGFMNARSRITGVATGDQVLFVDARVFSAIGGFPVIPLMEDVAISKTLRQLHAPYCSRVKVTTSARRWQQHGVFKTILKMWWYRLAFFFGVSPNSLARGYYDVR